MTEYASIRGTRVKYLSSDPTLNTSTEGQVWYNSTSGTLKSLVQIKAWSSGSNMGTARYNLAGAGTQTAGLAFNGSAYPNPPNPRTNSTEEYSGFTWSAGGNLNTTTLGAFGFGIQTAAVAASGDNNTPSWPLATQEYNGSTWTTVNNMTTPGRRNGDAVGILTAGVAFGGYLLTSVFTNATEEYDGTNWTAGGNLITAREGFSAAGTQTAALGAGGNNGSDVSNVEEYDGSTWTAGTSLPTARGAGSGSGIQTNALIFAGSGIATSLQYDGTNWTSSATMGTARGGLASAQAGTAVAALGFGGYVPGSGAIANTEEYNSNINAITVASLSSGGNLATSRAGLGGAGLQNSGLGFGGYLAPGVSNSTEEYNGSAWTAGGNLNTARAEICGNGTQTAAWANGGFSPSSSLHLNTEEYNGLAWTTVNNSNSSLRARGDAGTQTAGLMYSGFPSSNVTEEYDGTTWTVANSMVGTAGYKKGWGTQTAATSAGNSSDGGPAGTSVRGIESESYDGTNWTSNASLNFDGRVKLTVGQTGDSGAATGGRSEPSGTVRNVIEEWDGTSWKSAATLSTARYNGTNGIGTKSSGLFAGGSTPANSNATEEYTGETETVTASTLTTS